MNESIEVRASVFFCHCIFKLIFIEINKGKKQYPLEHIARLKNKINTKSRLKKNPKNSKINKKFRCRFILIQKQKKTTTLYL